MSASTPVPVRHRLRSVVSATLAGALIASGALLGSTAAYAETGEAPAPAVPATEQPAEQTPATEPAAEPTAPAESPPAAPAAPAAPAVPKAEAKVAPQQAPAAAEPAASGSVAASVAGTSAADGLRLAVTGTGLPDGQVYAGLIERGHEADVSTGGGYAAFAQPFPTVAGGQTSFALTAPVANLDRSKQYEVLVWKLHSQPDASTILARANVDLTPAQWNDLIPVTPQVIVSQTTGLDPGQTTEVTVRGTGFFPHAPETSGSRPPLAGKFTGVYVAFGSYAQAWQPSTGAVAATRSNVDQKWAVPAESMATIGGAAAGAIELTADGTFETTLKVSKNDAKAIADGSWGVVTYPGGGAKYAPFETLTSVTFATPTPKVTVSQTTGLDPGQTTEVTVRGTGFFPHAPETSGSRPPLAGKFTGVYVAFGSYAQAWQPSTGAVAATRSNVDQKWAVPAESMATIGGAAAGAIELQADGTFETTLKVSKNDAKAIADGSWGVVTYPGGGAKYAPFETLTPVAFATPTPKVTVSQTTGLDPEQTTEVTVRGTGFTPRDPDTTGKRPPLAGKFSGTYVVFGSFAEKWQPSAGAAAATRKAFDQKWAVPAESMATIGGAAGGAVELKADGTFETVLKVSKDDAKAIAGGSYGVATYSGSGATAAAFETFTPVAFATPKTTVAPTVQDAAETGLTVDVAIGRIALQSADAGVYAALIERGTEGSLSSDNMGAAVAYVTKAKIVDGAATATLVAPAAKLDRSKQYEVLVWRAHGNATPDRILGRGDVTVSDAQWNTVFPSKASGTAKVSTATVDGLGIDVALAHLDPTELPNGVYAGLIERGTADSATMATVAGAKWIRSIPASGEAAQTLAIDAAKLDRTKQYDVLVWKGHTNPSPETNVLVIPVSVSADQWNAVFPVKAPKLTVTPSTGLRDGDTVTVTGEGYDPQKPIYVTLCTDIPLEQVTFDFINAGCTKGAKAVGGKYGAPFGADGSFTVQMQVSPKEGSTAVYTIADHTARADRSQDAKATLQFTSDPVSPTAGAKVSDAGKDGLAVDFAGSGLTAAVAPQGVYIAVVETGTDPGTNSDTTVAYDYVTAQQITDGAFAKPLVVPPSRLDRAKTYEAIVWRAHGNATPEATFGRQALTVTDAQWDAIFPADPAPKAAAKVAKADAAGLQVAFTGSGFTAKQAPAGVYVAVVEAGTEPKQGEKSTLAAEYVTPQDLAGGALAKTVSLAKAQLDRTKSYEVVVWRAHGPATPSSTFLREKLAVSEDQWNVVFPTKAATGSLEWGVRETFRAYVTGPIAKGRIDVQKPATQSGGVYKFPQIVGGTWNAQKGTGRIPFSGNVNFSGHDGQLNLNLANPVIDVRDAKTALLQVMQNGKALTIATIDLASAERTKSTDGAVKFSGATVTLTADGANVFFQEYLQQDSKMDPLTFTAGAASGEKPVTPPVVKPVPKPKPKPQPKPAPTGGSAQLAGALTWGVSTPFANYVTGPIAKGGISTSGVGGGRGGYVFPQVTGGSWNPKTQTGTVQYSGVINYTGHKGALSESVANPTIRVTSATSGEVLVGGRVFGTLNLAAAQKSVGKNGEVTWSGVPVSGGFSYGSYTLGADPLTFTVGAANGARFGSTSVSGETPKRTAKDSAPTKSGITILTPADKLVPGGEIEFEATGFTPGERGILVVMYSKPVVLDENAGANAQGTVRWIGKLPKDLTGTHTITLQGSVDRGAVVKLGQTKALQIADAQVLDAPAPALEKHQAPAVVSSETPVWLWWTGAIALLVIAAALVGLVIAQRRGNVAR
ncbi:HtaA domain-containing protein [Leucobacter iarius]|uniref:Htaa domain-containing protein n=1 Tax=Leucobacter iarius TaxID=333963 RepID=A0ABP4XFR7_9MICO